MRTRTFKFSAALFPWKPENPTIEERDKSMDQTGK